MVHCISGLSTPSFHAKGCFNPRAQHTTWALLMHNSHAQLPLLFPKIQVTLFLRKKRKGKRLTNLEASKFITMTFPITSVKINTLILICSTFLPGKFVSPPPDLPVEMLFVLQSLLRLVSLQELKKGNFLNSYRWKFCSFISLIPNTHLCPEQFLNKPD